MLAWTCTISAHLAELDPLMQDLRDVAAHILSPTKLTNLELAATEALTNIIQHACSKRPGALIRVDLSKCARGVSLLIVDEGDAMNEEIFTNAANLDEIDPMSESGRGIAMINACADEVQYKRLPNSNSLTLCFYNGTNP